MALSKKRPTFLRFVLSILAGLLISALILIVVQQLYQSSTQKSALIEPFFILAAISAAVISLFLLFPVNRPGAVIKGILRMFVLLVVVAVLWIGGGFYIAQDEVMYMPDRVDEASELALAQNPLVEEVVIPGGEGLHYQGYLLKSAPGEAGLILYFGGNGELAATRVNALITANFGELTRGYHFMFIDYPGYGRSDGAPGEESIYQMALAAWDYALNREDADPSRIVIAGWSLGTGTAARLAAEKDPAGLILLAPFYNGTELVSSAIVSITGMESAGDIIQRWPVNLLVRNRYTSAVYAGKTRVPTLVIGGKADQTIPYEQAERLAQEYKNGSFVLLEGGHGAMWTEQASLQAIGLFLAMVGQQTPDAPPSLPEPAAPL